MNGIRDSFELVNLNIPSKHEISKQKFNNVLDELKYYTQINEYTRKIFEEKGMPALLNYLNKNQRFVAATIPADWGGIIKPGSSLLGKFGHHAFIELPGNRTCEWSSDKTDSTKKHSQDDVRMVPGKVIEKIWKTHQKLIPNYLKWNRTSTTEGFSNYRPFKNDCFSYVDRLLVENDQKPCALERIEDGLIKSAFSVFFPKEVANAYMKPANIYSKENTIFNRNIDIYQL